MASYNIAFKRSVKKDLKYLPQADILHILSAIKDLANEPRPPQTKRLTDIDRYCLRCGYYRVLYAIKDQVLHIIIIKVSPRKDAFR